MNDKSGTGSKVMMRQIVRTEDGSTSLEIPDMDEMYHSRKGAIKESQYVYIDHGFKLVTKDSIDLLEIGMGTGLNVLLSYLASGTTNVNYHSLEPYPLIASEWQQLNFSKILGVPNDLIKTIHTCEHNAETKLSKDFSLIVSHEKLETIEFKKTYDLIYFDAFAPNKQESPWRLSNIQKVYDLLNPGGILTTYCSQGQFKRNLKAVGFNVTNPEGPMGKREITVAFKSE
ncbi:MAG: tRNA U34 5-methylaminomethyl-2-thiouridine-forming methyltransferase MnmC [Bacteroidia bacterium]|jgi:tRNA U34 5-methylaminomethyl-2-thiouridine-forming methyltransferase MnmC